MALFQSYAPPSVYTQVVIQASGAPLFGNARIPVIIGEGQTFFTFPNAELIRGSSAVADNQVIDEDLSNQVTGLVNTFKVTFFPVTDGTGKGIVTNDPTKIQATSEGLPLVITSLNGATGVFTTQQILPLGNDLHVTYFFKKTDTLISNEDESAQIPTFSSEVLSSKLNEAVQESHTVIPNSPPSAGIVTVTNAATYFADVAVQYASTGVFLEKISSGTPAVGQYSVSTGGVYLFNTADEGKTVQISYLFTIATSQTLTASLTIPGGEGNQVSIALTFTPGSGQPDALAVTGAGTNAISIELVKGDNIHVRSLNDINTLISAGIPTTLGFLTGVLSSAVTTFIGTPQPATFLSSGSGPNSNTVFKTHFLPIVDGTNGGVVTTDVTKVTALVNGVAATVAAVNGLEGLVTMAAPVLPGSTFTLTYWMNQYQFTSDLLPGIVASIVQVGLAPNRSDFIQNTDFQLSQDGTLIAWGANADTAVGTTNPNSSIVFGPAQITTTLVDEQVWLRLASGSVNGINASFTLQDVPVDGSGLNRPLGNPSSTPATNFLDISHISVYVGPDPITALTNGPVKLASVDGDSAQVVLFNPPTTGNNVYASYWRSQLNDHTFTLTVAGVGQYSVTNELSQIVPNTLVGTASVKDANFTATGIVWPNNFSDLNAEANDKAETVTLTFQDDGLHTIGTPAVNATLASVFGGSTVTFTATEIGSDGLEPIFTGPNGVTAITFVGNALEPMLAQFQVYTSAGFWNSGSPNPLPFTSVPWQAGHVYVLGQVIYDPITNTVQVVTTPGTSGATVPTFSAVSGTQTADNQVEWTSNGVAPTTAESIFINTWSLVNGVPTQNTLNNVVALFSTPNAVSTPLAGKITAAVTAGSGATLATPAVLAKFAGGANPTTTLEFSQRFLVTTSVALGAGTGQAQTPATPNVGAIGPWQASYPYAQSQVVSYVFSGATFLAQANVAGTSSGASPFASGTTGTQTTDGSITWTTIGPAITPVGAVGYLGQTYVDTNTGVKFTIVDPAKALSYGYTSLPSPQYKFRPGDTLTFVISPTTPFQTGSTPIINILGLRTKVSTTLGATVGDTATIQTFKGNANEPNVGEFYFITYTVNKTTTDMALKIYTNATDAYAAYGQPSVINRVSLGVQLMTLNGAQQFGVVQVPQQPGQNVGSDANYESAIQSLAMNLPGTNRKVNVIVPLSTSQAVQQFLGRFLTTQSSPRQKGEAIGFIGMGLYNTPAQASALANSIKNARVILVAPFAFAIQITNPTTGVAQEFAVSAEFAAAALAGLNVNPSNDVAQSLTNQNVVGFSRILQRLDDPTMDSMAANGVTLLVEQSGGLLVRHYKSTDPSNVITSEPTCTTITDFISQAFRSDLQQFIGRKLIGSLLGSIQIVANSRMKSSLDANLIQGFSAPIVTQDPNDPTTVNITLTFQPIFPLLYIGVTFTVTSSSVTSSGASAGSATGSGNIGSGSGSGI